MTEYQKMISGTLYDPTDKELYDKRTKARQLAIEYNLTSEDRKERRTEILKELLGRFGENLFMEPSVKFDYGCNTFFGDDCFVNFNSVFLDCGKIHIGNNVFIGPNVSFYAVLHPLVADQRNMRKRENKPKYELEYTKSITVGNNVWIGGSVTINAGVTIGDNTVIGAGSVVTKDIPSGVIAVGVPCRVLREITEDDRMDEDIKR